MRIAIGNHIVKSDPFAWVDEKVLKIAAGLDTHLGFLYFWEEESENKKELQHLWSGAVDNLAEKINKLASPVDAIVDHISSGLERFTALDPNGVIHTIPKTARDKAVTNARNALDSAYASQRKKLVNIPTKLIEDKVVDESWKWDWDLTLKLNFTGGSLTPNPRLRDVRQWIDSISEDGFNRDDFILTGASVRSTITGDGKIANADVSIELTGLVLYGNTVIVDIESGETTEGRLVYGFGIMISAKF